MKFKIENTSIPQDKREDINNKILYIIDNNVADQHNITKNDIATMYSGFGGLSGLEFKDFDNYYEFSEAKKSAEQGAFYTPDSICKFMTDCIKPTQHDLIADLTFGCGRFFNYLPTESNIYGTEIDIKAYKVCKYLYPEANIMCEDIRMYNPDVKFDVVIGNPPFNLKLQVGREEYLSQLYFCIKASQLLKPAGLMCIIVPNSFLADDFSDKGMIKEVADRFNFVCQFDLSPYAFKDVGVSYFETKVMIFQNKSEFLDEVEYNTNKIELHNISESESDRVYNTYIKPLIEKKDKVKNKIFFENLHSSDSKEDIEFGYKVKKLLYDIKRNPKISKKFAKAQEYVFKYYNQKKPENMEWNEWDKVKVTMPKVISYLTKIVREQHRVERDEIELVKTNGSIKLKAYSRKMKLVLNKYTDVKEMDINSMVYHNNYPFSDPKFARLIEKKRKNFEVQSKSFKDMILDNEIQGWLDKTTLYDSIEDKTIKLNDKQKHDINFALQKNSCYLAWETGGGKSLSSLFYAMYRLENSNVENIFIVAPAIAIKNTYIPMLENYNLSFTVLNTIDDINNIKDKQFVLITFNILSKNCAIKYNKNKDKKDKSIVNYNMFVKKYIKKIGYKNVCLVLDEADQISNISSKRSKAALDTFRRVKYKLLCSGTSVRNNLSEFKTSLDMMYNNSILMLSNTQYIYEEGKDGITDVYNELYNTPIPAYKKGYKLYSSMFNPSKTTVLGISQYNQNIYNKDELKEIIDRTIIVRTLKDITGRDLYNMNQVPCIFSKEEKDLYLTILDEFHTMVEYHIKTGNSRKDAMFKILAQLNTLLKSCSIPQTFRQYTGGIPNKFTKTIQLLKKFENERVAVGCTRIKTVNLYKQIIQDNFPNRPIFVVTGDSTTMKQRRDIVEFLKQSDNGIILSTMQSLSCSVSIGFVDKVIIVENLWNDSSVQQFRARFTRYDSDNVTQIYNLFYKDSIEANLMKLILCKEKLCLFMKNEDIEDDEELFEKYGIDSWIFNCLMTKYKDEKGGVHIGWGEQQIV